MRIWLATLAFVGCSKPAPDCAHAVGGAVERMIADAKATMPADAIANVERIAPEMKAQITAACVDDRWAPEVVRCLEAAASQREMNACDQRLTAAQRAAERKRTDAILKAAIAPGAGSGSK